jgi:hypothetical protein
VHLVVWVKQTEQRAHLLFSMTAISVAAIAACELLLMRAQTTEQFCTVLRWAHVPVFFAVVSIVAFVRLYFRAGRPWLAYLVCGLRLLALIEFAVRRGRACENTFHEALLGTEAKPPATDSNAREAQPPDRDEYARRASGPEQRGM